MNQNFSMQVGKWVEKAKKNKVKVFKEASKELVTVMQKPVMNGGRMPVQTGFLRASLVASIKGANNAVTRRPSKDATYPWDPGQVFATIESINRVNQKLSLNYTAIYASIAESRYGFMRLSMQKWDTIVNKVTRKINPGGRSGR